MRGETVAVEIDDVDVRGAQSETLFEDAGAFVDQGVEAAVDDFVGGNLVLRCTGFGNPFRDELFNDGIGADTAIGIVFVPACTGFLAEAAEFAKIIFGEGLTDSGLLQMAIFFANAPADVESGEVANG